MSFLQNVRFQLRMCKFAFNHYNNPYRLGFFFNNVVRPQNKNMLHFDDSLRQRHLQFLLFTSQSQYQGARRETDWAEYLPKFVQEGSQVKVKNSWDYIKFPSGIMYRNIEHGEGEGIKEKQMFPSLHRKKLVSLRYDYYDQSGTTIFINESFEGSLDQLDSLVHSSDKFGPGLKEGIIGMKPKGKRIIIILLQEKYGVFGVELRSIHHEWNPFG